MFCFLEKLSEDQGEEEIQAEEQVVVDTSEVNDEPSVEEPAAEDEVEEEPEPKKARTAAKRSMPKRARTPAKITKQIVRVARKVSLFHHIFKCHASIGNVMYS